MVNEERSAENARHNLLVLIKGLRTDVKLNVILSNGRSFDEILEEPSKDADLVIIGMATPGENFLE